MTVLRTSEQLQADIMIALKHGKLDQYQIAADITEAPFRVRAELKELRRRRLVREEYGARAVLWELTESGYTAALAADQLQIS
jgi:predicted transcriptional regulator